MAEIIHLQKQRKGLRPKERSFEAVEGEASILMFTGVRYERTITDNNVAKPNDKRITGR